MGHDFSTQHRRIDATGGEPTARDEWLRHGPASVFGRLLAFVAALALGIIAAAALLHFTGALQ